VEPQDEAPAPIKEPEKKGRRRRPRRPAGRRRYSVALQPGEREDFVQVRVTKTSLVAPCSLNRDD
jgi:hypothetical protein